MSLPYYKRFPRDFLEGTIGLSFEAKCAYGIVLDLIYMKDGRLPDDARYIAGQLGCSVRKWTAILSDLVKAGKLQVSDGFITNFRADHLTEESRKYQDKQSEIAGKPRKNKAQGQPKHSQPEPEPETEESKASSVPPPKASKPVKRATRIPDDWSPSPACQAYAEAEGLTPQEISRAAADFRDFWSARAGRDATKLDWPATWRQRVRTLADRKRPASPTGRPKASGDRPKPASMAGILAERRRQAAHPDDVSDDGWLLRPN